MKRRLIIDGNAVYELDEECMLEHRLREGGDSPKDRREKQENKAQE